MTKDIGIDTFNTDTSDSETRSAVSNNEKIKIAFHGLGNKLYFALKPTTKLRRIADLFAETAKIPVDQIRFSLDGRPIQLDSTPRSCGMVSADVVDVSQVTDGGYYVQFPKR